MITKLLHRLKNAQKGDTIVEVTLALTVLALVLGTSTVLANRNTKTLQNAQEKNVALRMAQEQLEFLKTRVAADKAILTTAPAKFCMTGANSNPVASTDPNCVTAPAGAGATYQKSITLTAVNTEIFDAKATVEWETLTSFRDADGNLINTGKAQLSYRVYTKLGASRNPTATTCEAGKVYHAPTGTCIPAPKVTISASRTTIAPGESATLNWSSQYVTACTASGAWNGSRSTSGTSTVSPSATSTYTLSCSGTGGTATSSVTVIVKPPRIPLYSCYQFNHYAPTPHVFRTNHVLTTNLNSCDGNGYGTGVREGIVGYVPVDSSQNPGAVPVYGGLHSTIVDDFYTTDYQEYVNAHYSGWYDNSGYKGFYLYPYNNGCAVPGTVPLYRWYSGVTGDHVYIPGTGSPNGWYAQDGGGTFVWEGARACIFNTP
jgi:hypothetical protein